MTMRASFDSLLDALRDFRAALAEHLAWSVANARPPGWDGHALADRFDDWCVEASAAAGEAELAGLHGHAAAEGRLDLDRSALALVALHGHLRRSARLFNARLASFRAHDDLRRLAEDEVAGQDWAGWASEVANAVTLCRAPLDRAEDEVAAAWAQWAEVACAAARVGTAPPPCRLEVGKREAGAEGTDD